MTVFGSCGMLAYIHVVPRKYGNYYQNLHPYNEIFSNSVNRYAA